MLPWGWARTLVALAGCFALLPDVQADETAGKALLHACWSPAMLAGQPGERSRKRDKSFDILPPPDLLDEVALTSAAVPTGAVRRVNLSDGRKLVALTFDLCEQPGEIAGYDGALIDFLRREKIKATFFAGGKWMRSHEERTRQLMSDPLFELGNHAEAHRNLRLLDGSKLHDEVAGPQRAYEAIRARHVASQCVIGHEAAMQSIPAHLKLFRFPYGACNARALEEVSAQGLRAVQWDISTADSTPEQSAAAIARSIANARPGSIILSHANGRGWHTAAALPQAIEKLRLRGFEFVTVSELLAAGEPVIEQECYNVRPGDTNRYDNPIARQPAPQRKVTQPAFNPFNQFNPFQ